MSSGGRVAERRAPLPGGKPGPRPTPDVLDIELTALARTTLPWTVPQGCVRNFECAAPAGAPPLETRAPAAGSNDSGGGGGDSSCVVAACMVRGARVFRLPLPFVGLSAAACLARNSGSGS